MIDWKSKKEDGRIEMHKSKDGSWSKRVENAALRS